MQANRVAVEDTVVASITLLGSLLAPGLAPPLPSSERAARALALRMRHNGAGREGHGVTLITAGQTQVFTGRVANPDPSLVVPTPTPKRPRKNQNSPSERKTYGCTNAACRSVLHLPETDKTRLGAIADEFADSLPPGTLTQAEASRLFKTWVRENVHNGRADPHGQYVVAALRAAASPGGTAVRISFKRNDRSRWYEVK